MILGSAGFDLKLYGRTSLLGQGKLETADGRLTTVAGVRVSAVPVRAVEVRTVVIAPKGREVAKAAVKVGVSRVLRVVIGLRFSWQGRNGHQDCQQWEDQTLQSTG